MSETALRKAIIDALARLGIDAYHVQSWEVRVRGDWMKGSTAA